LEEVPQAEHDLTLFLSTIPEIKKPIRGFLKNNARFEGMKSVVKK
jgi:hypothetical protein